MCVSERMRTCSWMPTEDRSGSPGDGVVHGCELPMCLVGSVLSFLPEQQASEELSLAL